MVGINDITLSNARIYDTVRINYGHKLHLLVPMPISIVPVMPLEVCVQFQTVPVPDSRNILPA